MLASRCGYSADLSGPVNDRPNPFRRDANWAQLPMGLKWGAVIGASVLTLLKEWLKDLLPTRFGASGNRRVGGRFDNNPFAAVRIAFLLRARFNHRRGKRALLVQMKSQGHVHGAFHSVDAHFAIALRRVRIAR